MFKKYEILSAVYEAQIQKKKYARGMSIKNILNYLQKPYQKNKIKVYQIIYHYAKKGLLIRYGRGYNSKVVISKYGINRIKFVKKNVNN